MKTLTCHCGAVEIQVNLKKEIDKLMRCNCSMCKRKGTMVTIIDRKDLKIIKGEDKIKIYQFNTKVAKHHFFPNFKSSICSSRNIGKVLSRRVEGLKIVKAPFRPKLS